MMLICKHLAHFILVFFVAEQVKLPTLYSQLWKYSNGPTIADHAFHEFSFLRLATENEITSLDLW